MPAGNDQLISLSWQQVPGTDGASIYPIVRKIDTISSNSYLIATPDAIILIDPGGLPDQAEQLASVIGEIRQEQDRPVIVFLTHAHIDHFAGSQDVPAFAHPETVIFAAHETGAGILGRGDCGFTQADLLGQKVVPMKIGFPLLTADRSGRPGVPVDLRLANGARVAVTDDRIGTGGVVLPRERIVFGPGPALEILHTPGHSPDSICLRVGGLLFIGDILFAANPGVAGMRGWDQAALIRSLDGILAFLSGGGVSYLCPGHGRVIPVDDAVRVLSAVRTDALALANIAELNCDRAVQAAAFAEDCMEQVNELFTVMAGRLSYVSYVMEELGESDVAGRMESLINRDTIDELLKAFSDFAEEHYRRNRVPIHLALKAAQVIMKLERSFRKDELSRIIDPTLVQRAGRLLSGYTTMMRGFSPPGELSECDIIALVEALVTGLSVSSCSDEEVFDSADDDAAFAQILLARIGTRPLLEDVAFSMEPMQGPLMASIDRDHFTDVLRYIFEELVGTGADRVMMKIQRDSQNSILTISGNTTLLPLAEQQKTFRFLQGLCHRAGGSLEYKGETETRQFVITIGLA
ncbi:MAG: MBL fold metallo-hydrolase [Methanoregula sp.]|uniref:MBL fold metallo-hydrolase n=1 Tax=Methanoregula sp. TaxID=2052170 RepID=UPI003D137864